MTMSESLELVETPLEKEKPTKALQLDTSQDPAFLNEEELSFWESLRDPRWRLNNLYYIIDKNGKRVKFKPNWAQLTILDNLWFFSIILKARQLGVCLDPDTKVLRADLKWVKISELNPGDKVVSVDEKTAVGRGIGRKMRTGEIQGVMKVKREAYRISFDDGRSVICTAKHPWLSRQIKQTDCRWRTIDGNQKDDVRKKGKSKLKVGTQIRWVTKPWEEPTYEDGWVGGMIDGEGSLSKNCRGGVNIGISQVEGPVLDRLINYVKEKGYNYRTEIDKRNSKFGLKDVHKIIFSRLDEVFRLLGQTKPARFLGRNFWEGKELPGKKSGIGWATITSIEPLGMRTMIDLQTSMGTYIAEGFVSHNTTFFCILYLDQILFSSNKAAGIIAHTDADTKKIFQRIKYAWENLPEQLKQNIGLPTSDSVGELRFPNGSSIFVARSTRGSTLQYLHISEFAKICAKYPEKAREIVTGAINSVEKGNFVSIESTAEGKEGSFADYCMEAQQAEKENRELSELDFKYFFFPWWKEPAYRLESNAPIPKEFEQYFQKLESEHQIFLDSGQKQWYVSKKKKNDEDMYREYPSCVSGDVLVHSVKGIEKIKDVEVDGVVVLNKFDQGLKETFTVLTENGYSFRCTGDHKIKTKNGFLELQSVKVGDYLVIGGYDFGTKIQKIKYSPVPFVDSEIVINEDMSRFIGYFMGDGSFYANQLSVVCEGKDEDVIKDVSLLMERLFKKINDRKVGNKKGGVEVRLSDVKLAEYFYAMDIIYKNQKGKGHYKRKIHVPDYIKKSPKKIVKQFLMSLFESDGFAHKMGHSVKFFSKDESFIRDIQILLLAFGITSKLSSHNKKSSDKKYELCLRKKECVLFKKEIGFISKRKRDRLPNESVHINAQEIVTADIVKSIEPYGIEHVWDITTKTHEFTANGVVVHNCWEEAFMAQIQGAYYSQQMQRVYEDNRIRNVPYDARFPVLVFWDIGYNDFNVLLFVQKVGNEIRFIDCYYNHNEDLRHYYNIMKEKPYVYGTNYLPHDGNVASINDKKTRVDILRELGVRDIRVVERTKDITEDIEKVRQLFSRFYFDEQKCQKVIEACQTYKKEWDDKLGQFKNSPKHDTSSHFVSPIRTLSNIWRDFMIDESKVKTDILNFF